MQNKIANTLILSSSFIENIGLLNGKMGLAIYFFHLHRCTKEEIYQKYAEELIEEIFDEVTSNTTIDFENGLAGIAWGIEYLITNKYLEGDGNEILEDIDYYIFTNIIDNINRIDSLYESIGYGIYFLSRLNNQKEGNQKDTEVDFERALSALIVKMESLTAKYPIDTEYFKSFKNIQEYCLLLYFMFELKKSAYTSASTEELTKGILNKLLQHAFIMDCELLKLILCAANKYYTLNEYRLPDNSCDKVLDIDSFINKDLLLKEVENDLENKRIKSLLVGLLYKLIYLKSENKNVLLELDFWVNYSSKINEDFIMDVNFKSNTMDLGIKAGLSGFGLLKLFIDEMATQSKEIIMSSNL